MSFAPSAPSETTRSKYFTTKKGVNTQRPSTRSHSENTGNTSVSSTSDENERILSDLEEIKNAIKSTVKTSELEEIRSDIKSTVKKDDLKNIVTSMVKELMKEQRKEFDHKIKEANDLNRKERSKMQDEIDKLRLENEDLRENLSAKRAEIGELRDISEAAIEKASEARRNNVKVYGLQEVRGENTGDEVIKLLKDKSDTTLLPEEFVAAHRIPGAPNQPRPVIVKLKNSDVKSRVIKQRSTIKSAKIGVRLADDVTRENSKLMERLNEHDMIESCWFFNGSVFGKVNGSERKVKFDIDDVIAERIRASKRHRNRKKKKQKNVEKHDRIGLKGRKYPCEKEKFVRRIETTEHKIIDELDKEEYYKRIAICDNVVPRILRSMRILNEKNILLEEELWMNSTSRVCRVKSRNLTWSKYANMWEESSFKPSMENPHWTVFEQHGTIDIKGIGPFGRIMEVFAKQFLHAGVKRSLNIMEHLLSESYSNKVQYSQKGDFTMTDLISNHTKSQSR